MFKKLIATIKTSFVALLLVAGGVTVLGLAQPVGVSASTVDSIRQGSNDAGGSSSGGDTVKTTVTAVINILLFLIGMIAVLMIVIAGFRFVTSNGDQNTVSSAKNTILYAVIGIIVAISAYAIVNFILGQFVK